MGKRLRIGGRYCGGCNPCYDRTDELHRLTAAHPELPLNLLICGCHVQCVSREDLTGPVFSAHCPEQFRELSELIEGMLQNRI